MDVGAVEERRGASSASSSRSSSCSCTRRSLILLVFSFNNSQLPVFPLSGFTFHWYHEFFANGELRGSLETSAIIAAVSSVGAVLLGMLASIALTRRRFRGKALVSALLLSPLVIPYVVFGISLLLLFHTARHPAVGPHGGDRPHRHQPAVHDPRPRPAPRADRPRPRGGRIRPRRRARSAPSERSPSRSSCPRSCPAFLIAFTTSFDEYAVASFVVGTRETFPIYLYSALRFPSQLPQVIAVAVVVLTVSLVVVVGAELGRRNAERKLAL